jgi:hypothetical protein
VAYKWPATWIKSVDLCEAMNTTDPTNGKSRGFVEVSPRE